MQYGSDRSLEGVKNADYTDYERTENFGYLIDFKTKAIFHQGDAALKINKLALNKLNRKIDVAYLSFFDRDSTSYNLLNKNLQTENIIFMHETKPGKEFETDEFKIIEPKLIFFKKELESRLFK